MSYGEKRVFIIFSAILGSILIFVVGYLVYFAIKYPLNYKGSIKEYSRQFNLQPELIASVINAESGFDKDAISSKGAVGLMQLMPRTAVFAADILGEEINAKSLTDSGTNIRLGCCYLEYLMDKFGDEKTALACYNAGEGVVARWLENSEYSYDGKTLKDIPYKETKEYIKRVLSAKDIYKSKLSD